MPIIRRLISDGRTTLLKEYLKQQVILLGAGLLFALAAIIFLQNIQQRTEDVKLRTEIEGAMVGSIDQWRAWHFLGMTEAIDSSFKKLQEHFPVTRYQFLKRSEIPEVLGSDQFVLPKTNEPSVDLYLLVDYRSPNALLRTFSEQSTYITVAAVLFLVISNIFLGFRFFLNHIYLPLVHLKDRLASSDGRAEVDFKMLGQGEIREIITDMSRILGENELLRVQRQELEKQAMIGEFAAQLSHDIRSPLSALSMVVGSIKALPEGERVLIRNATQRINDIANGLLQKSKESRGGLSASGEFSGTGTADPVMLVALVDAIASEKRHQHRSRIDIEIQTDLEDGYGIFAAIDPIELSRAISNLVNNAVEAIEGKGLVQLAIRKDPSNVYIYVSDNGNGIPPEILHRFGEKGLSFGKNGTDSGSGLGVYQARKAIEEVNGRLSVQSAIGQGTQISIKLPRANAPAWFVHDISLRSGTILVTVDDDPTIHQVWSGRLAPLGARSDVEQITFGNIDAFIAWARRNTNTDYLCLIDYEFIHSPLNGLKAIEELRIEGRSTLVTSRYEDQDVRVRAATLGIRIIPKQLASLVPLKIKVD